MKVFFQHKNRRAPILGFISFFLIFLFYSPAVMGEGESILPALDEELVKKDYLSSAREGVLVKTFRFEGNTVVRDDELLDVISPYLNRIISNEDLQNARRLLTKKYIDKGYITSGAILEDQKVIDGIITFGIIEGELAEVELEGYETPEPVKNLLVEKESVEGESVEDELDEELLLRKRLERELIEFELEGEKSDDKSSKRKLRLRHGFIESRIKFGAGSPLNFNSLQQYLVVFQNNPNIKSINAELQPGLEPGQSKLKLKIEENQPYHLEAVLRNDRPPSVGAEILEIIAYTDNLLGFSDRLMLEYGAFQRDEDDDVRFSELDNLGVNYSFPVCPSGTTLTASYKQNDFAIIEVPFDTLDIESESWSLSLGISQPIIKTIQKEFTLSLAAERKHSESFFSGQPFSFSAGTVNGEADLAVFRLSADWLKRDESQVLALRSTVNVGADLFHATDNGTDRDGQFLSITGQVQYVRLFGEDEKKRKRNQFIYRGSFQWANDPLLSLEQFSIGGSSTVRGYRENQIVRDTGIVMSVETRIPVWEKGHQKILQIAPFMDFGVGWNIHDDSAPRPRAISSMGIGFLFNPNQHLSANVYWGFDFQDFNNNEENDAQDSGFHFDIRLTAF